MDAAAEKVWVLTASVLSPRWVSGSMKG
jgi:hypothetical protein